MPDSVAGAGIQRWIRHNLWPQRFQLSSGDRQGSRQFQYKWCTLWWSYCREAPNLYKETGKESWEKWHLTGNLRNENVWESFLLGFRLRLVTSRPPRTVAYTGQTWISLSWKLRGKRLRGVPLFSASAFCLQVQESCPCCCRLPASRSVWRAREGQAGGTQRFCMADAELEERNVRGKSGVATYALLRNLDFSIESDEMPL